MIEDNVCGWVGSGCLFKLFMIFLGFLGVLIAFIVIGLLRAPDFTTIRTPAGYPVNIQRYVQLDERTHVWISVWLPDTLAEGDRLPTLMTTSRYAELLEPGWLMKVLMGNLGQPDRTRAEAASRATDHGYAYVYVQSPGSCQSSGPRPMEYPPAEIEAMGLVIDWIVQQPWSNGRVGTFGHSYSATTADMSCATGRSALRAVHAEAPDFDLYCQNVRPGGLGSMAFIQTWGGLVQAMDADDICLVYGISEGRTISMPECLMVKSMIRGLQRPKKGPDRTIFRQAMEDHRGNMDVAAFIRLLEFKDSRDASHPERSYAIDELSLHHYREAIEAARVNVMTTVGWMDAGTVEGALQKFLTFDTPQIVTIIPAGHDFEEQVDPFGDNRPWTDEEKRDYYRNVISYFDRHLKQDGVPEERLIRYWTFAENEWHETNTWPPEGITDQTWYFADDGELGPELPAEDDARDEYAVNFAASTGRYNRWMTQMGEPVRYGDRMEEDRKLLTFTSRPLIRDLEVTGSPTVILHVASTHTDGAFHVYLEDVSPSGRVSYLTEGMIRAIHRQRQDPAMAPVVPLGVWRSYTQKDALPMVPGDVTEIAITMMPISTVFHQNHRIRIALAGHDKAMIDRYPPQGDPTVTVHRSVAYPSRMVLPCRERRQ